MYAGGVMRTDGSRIVFSKEIDYYDCCNLEALFKEIIRVSGKLKKVGRFQRMFGTLVMA